MTKTYTVPPPPPHNEGKTVAAWTLNLGTVLGAVLIALGMVMSLTPVIYVGIVVIALSIIAGIALSLAGHGKKRAPATES